MIQKLAPGAQGHGGTVNLTQLATAEDSKTCYIAQPFGYNYALVNQMQLAQNGVTIDGRVQNPISNISFKCDVCGLMFGHLTLLNAHKRIHSQDTGNVQVSFLCCMSSLFFHDFMFLLCFCSICQMGI